MSRTVRIVCFISQKSFGYVARYEISRDATALLSRPVALTGGVSFHALFHAPE